MLYILDFNIYIYEHKYLYAYFFVTSKHKYLYAYICEYLD